jgi:hypothetical protein
MASAAAEPSVASQAAAAEGGACAGGAVIKLACKWGSQKIDLEVPVCSTVGRVREMLQEHTRVPSKRQKLVGLGKRANPDDSLLLDNLQLKNPHSFMMIGAPDEFMMLEASQIDDMPEVINDLDQDFVYDPRKADESAKPENRLKLEQMIKTAEINVMHPPRPGKHGRDPVLSGE